MALIDAVLADGGKVVAHDPIAGDNARTYYGNQITVVEDPYVAAEGAEALVLVTEWRLYQSPDFERLKEIMVGSLILDGRNIWSTYELRTSGFIYEGIGVIGT
jgi:UDPglucose 6-dehydrogenase